jgi:hypothetical protein
MMEDVPRPVHGYPEAGWVGLLTVSGEAWQWIRPSGSFWVEPGGEDRPLHVHFLAQ